MPKSSQPGHAQTILITAGEPSGDRLGGALMAALKAKHPHLKFIGVGGESMIAQGLNPVFPMSDLAVMGLFEVIPAIPRVLARLRQLTVLARQAKPALVITIDSQDFSTRLAKALKSSNPHTLTPIPHIHYVAPKVWAWRQHRVKKLPGLYTHLLTILPFEQEFFSRAGLPTTYVGHPATTALTPFKSTPAAPPSLALLPGSRSTEFKRHWPLFLQTYRLLRAQNPKLTAVLALPSKRALHICTHLAPWSPADQITPVYGENRFPLIAKATAALSKSGTNNLELAILGIPAVVVYRMHALTYAIAKHMVKVPYISLPNLILHYAGKTAVYPEFIQHAATPHNLATALQPLLKAKSTQKPLLATFQKLMETPQPPAELAATVISKYL